MEGSLLRSPSPFLICLNVFLVLNKQRSLTTMNEDTILVSVPTVQFLKVTGKSCRKPSFPPCLRQQSTIMNFFTSEEYIDRRNCYNTRVSCARCTNKFVYCVQVLPSERNRSSIRRYSVRIRHHSIFRFEWKLEEESFCQIIN